LPRNSLIAGGGAEGWDKMVGKLRGAAEHEVLLLLRAKNNGQTAR